LRAAESTARNSVPYHLSYTLPPMIRASKVREIILQILYTWDAAGTDDDAVAIQIAQETEPTDATARVRSVEAAHKIWAWRKDADEWIERLSPQWPPRRQPPVDRNLLRSALWEMTQGQVPQKVVLDEAIELAKSYGAENSATFINGVLDAVMKEIGGLTTPTA